MDADSSDTSEASVVAPLESEIVAVPYLFDDPDGDVILKTPDGKNFQVSKVILKFASPVFKTMFSLPQPSSEESSENPTPLPTISISESSTTLDLLLRFSYPVERPDVASEIRDVAGILDVLCAARKYELDFTLDPVQKAFKKRVEASEEAAMTGFALASHRNLTIETRLAANACLKWSLQQIRDVVVPEFKFLPTMDYTDLLKFHENAGQAVTDLFKNYHFLHGSCFIGRCGSCCFQKVAVPTTLQHRPSRIDMRSWWVDWSKFLIGALREVPLDVGVISLSTLSPFYMNRACEECRKKLFDEWETGRDAMIDAITNEVDKVQLKLGWM